MDYIKVENYIKLNERLLFPNKNYTRSELTEALVLAPEELESVIFNMPLRKPLVAQALSFVGLDRYYLGDIVKGLIKNLTLNGLLIWLFVDECTAMKRCRTYNCKNLMGALANPSAAEKLSKENEMVQGAVNTGKKYAPVVKEAVKGLKNVRDGFFVN